MVEIIPAIMPQSLSDLEAQLARVKGHAPYVQIDVVDGKFDNDVTWPYHQGQWEEFACMAREEAGIPLWEEFNFEIDLMVQNPETVVGQWQQAGAGRLIVHIESTQRFDDIVREIKAHGVAGDTPTLGAIELGLALGIETPNDTITPYLAEVDFVQFMGIANIGSQGEPFDERVLSKIKALRLSNPETIISVDGGVNFDTAPRLIEAGANRLAIGSAILKSDDVRRVIEDFRALSNQS